VETGLPKVGDDPLSINNDLDGWMRSISGENRSSPLLLLSLAGPAAVASEREAASERIRPGTPRMGLSWGSGILILRDDMKPGVGESPKEGEDELSLPL
jgi:hypothetical protein